jgi:hypothetical protein
MGGGRIATWEKRGAPNDLMPPQCNHRIIWWLLAFTRWGKGSISCLGYFEPPTQHLELECVGFHWRSRHIKNISKPPNTFTWDLTLVSGSICLVELWHGLGVVLAHQYHKINHHAEFTYSLTHSFMLPHLILVTWLVEYLASVGSRLQSSLGFGANPRRTWSSLCFEKNSGSHRIRFLSLHNSPPPTFSLYEHQFLSD